MKQVEETRNKILNLGLQTHHGFTTLGSSMTSKINWRVKRLSLLRKVAMYDPMPEGKLPYYDFDTEEDNILLYWNEDKHLTSGIGSRVVIDPFELIVKGIHRNINDLRANPYQVIQEMSREMEDAWIKKENETLVSFLEDCFFDCGMIKKIDYIQRYISKLNKLHQSYHIILTRDLLVDMANEFLVDWAITNRGLLFIAGNCPGKKYCWIIKRNALWLPHYTEVELVPYISDWEDNTKNIPDGAEVGFTLYMLLGLGINPKLCRFFGVA